MSLLGPILLKCLSRRNETVIVDDRRAYTGAELIGASMFLADRITQTTDARNIGVILPTSGAFAVALLATWLAKRTLVPFNYLLNKEELGYVIGDSRADTLITAGQMLGFMGGPEVLPPGLKLIKIEEVDFRGVPPLRWPPVVDRDDDAVILYTSGTSAKPKGVMLSHGNLESNVRAAIRHAEITSSDGFLGVLPQFHSFGLTALTLLPLMAGAKIVYSARFVPRRIVELIREHKPDVFMGVPSMYGAMLTVKNATPADFASVRLPISGGEPLPDAIALQCRERFGINLMEGYGLTETSPILTWSTPNRHRAHSVGTALPGVDILIVDDHDNPLPTHHDGEILVSGPGIMKGYYRQPQTTAAVTACVTTAGGLFRGFRTGDIGRLDDDGFLYITGRKKEMLKVAGEIVQPREIEEHLNHHPSVKASAVIGKRDDLRGEVPVAFVEIHEGQVFDERALRDWCREKLAQYKIPRDFLHVETLPRNATGKILRRQLIAD
ncbi:MAG: AMP-binding protein [Planctomycetes bacterium]|nr:AMP-binding protein [Planctomycetota bacterium]